MSAEQIIAVIVGVFTAVVAVMAAALRSRGQQIQKVQVEANQNKREVEHLKAEREIEQKDNDEIAAQITNTLRRPRSRDDGSNEGGSR